MPNKGTLTKSLVFQLGFTVFVAIFGAIYEIFSHEVYSYYMIYAFMIPLVLGVGLYIWMLLFGKKYPEGLSLRMWNYGIITLAVGCVFKGVLEIYGTTNRLIVVYPIAAALLLGIGAVSFFLATYSGREKSRSALERTFT